MSVLPAPLIPDWAVFARDLRGIVPLWLFIFHYSAGLYQDERLSGEDRFLKIAKGCLYGVLATLAFGFLYHRFENSRLMLLLAFPFATVLVFAVRLVTGSLYRKSVRAIRGRQKFLILGGGKTADSLRRRLERSAVCESLSRASLEEALAAVDRFGAHEVILAQMNLGKADLLKLSEECERRGVELKIVPGLLELRMGEVQIDQSLGVPTFRIYHTQFSAANFMLKRAFDLAFCAVFFAAFAVPWLLIVLLIKLDSRGPVLFKQARIGYKGRVFYAYKFRTMQTDAEARVASLRKEGGPYFKVKADPRVTRVGKWLRRFSLDEVPQFLNVFRGEMSVVGPRPLAVSAGELEALESAYGESARKVLNVMPGITGLWQVSGRSELQDDARFALDIYYIEHWSAGLDLKIILKTPFAVLSSRGAY